MSESLRFATVDLFQGIPRLVYGFEQRGSSLPESREASRERVQRGLADCGELLTLRQVHGARIEKAPWSGRPDADAGFGNGRGWLVGIETADCLPVLIVDPRSGLVGAAHAGWRGTEKGVTRALVRAMVREGALPQDLLAALGPAIGVCCYEVGDELRRAFRPEDERFFREGPRGRPHLDLRAANAAQLMDEKVSPTHIAHVDECTSCHPDRYFSYRRDGRGTGRMMSVIGWSKAPTETPSRRERG